MNTIAVLLLAAATSTGGLFGKPHVGLKKLTRGAAVADGPAPPGGMMQPPVGPGGAAAGGPQAGRRFPNVRSQVYFVDPSGMKIGWQTAAGNGNERVYLPAQLTVPARYNFTQGYIYRLKLTDIPAHPGLTLYPTIEVAPSTPATDAYLTHNPIPAVFTEEDFDQVRAGNFVTKVIYLPDPKYQELAVSGVETLVSTRLDPGVNPILEADRRGTILMILRVGMIDLEMPAAGTSAAVNGGMILNNPGTATLNGTTPMVTPDTAPSPFMPKPNTTTPAVPIETTPAPVPVVIPPSTMPKVPDPETPPADKPADTPTEKPADAPVDKPADAPPEKPTDPSVMPTSAPSDAPPPLDAPPKN